MTHLDKRGHAPSTAALEPALTPTLRQRAEAQIGIPDADEHATITAEMAAGLVHELRVHQIELEMQNDELRRTQEALELSLARYFDLYELAPVGYLTLNQLGLIQRANLAAASLLDTQRIHLLDQPLSRFIFPVDQDIHYRHRQQLWSTGERQSYEVRLRRTDGEPVWVRLETTLAPEVQDGLPLWRINLVDISELKRSERNLLDTQERLRLVAEIAELTFWEWDPRTNDVFFPPEWWRQTDYALGEIPRRLGDWAALLHPEDREQILTCLGCFAAEAHATPREIQYRLRRKDGIYRWFAARLEAIRDGADTLARVLLVHQDVTRRKEFEDQAVRLAQHDPLTGLPSRALLDQLANHMLASARRSGDQLAVLFFDLDHFKPINDTYGHAVGDRLLQSVAQRLRETFRAEDLVARLGGDEFVVVLASIGGSDDAQRAARTAIAALTKAHVIEGLELTCLPSLGISFFPQDGETIDQLIQRADTAMYHAKRISPGQYQFVTAELNRQAQAAMTLETRLRAGLQQGEFQLVYQPVLDTRNGVVTDVEALLRWQQADASEIAPLSFLPAAESSGMIHELGRWVFQEVCRQHQAWRQDGLPPISIAVNVTARQFHHQRFQQYLSDASQSAGIDPTALSLRVSEATLMQDMKASIRVLGELKQRGVRVTLDDFGLGCSSLSKLETLPLDRLEINRALVQRLSVAPRMPAIVDTIIGLGRALKLDIVAVGIESQADLDFFRQRDCGQVQGFYLGVPMSGEHFADWYRQHVAAAGVMITE